MLVDARFVCPSGSLSLKSLATATRRPVWVGMALAITVHLALTQIRTLVEQRKAAKPLTTLFVKRQPRLTKPLELKKRPRPKRRAMVRRMVSVKARSTREKVRSGLRPVEVLGSLARPQASISYVVSWRGVEPEPQALAQVIKGTLDSENRMDMSLELMDTDAMDTGRYHAMVIQDPADRRNIRGFLHIAVVHPTSATEEDMGWIALYVVPGLANLADAMNQYTGIRTDLKGRYSFNSAELFSTPWVYVRYGIRRGAITDGEVELLGKYALSGGFVHVDGHGAMWQQSWAEWLIVHALELNGLHRGRDWEFDKTHSDHPLYHCFFDFEDMPPGGHGEHYLCSAGYVVPQVPYLDTVSVGGRMILMYCPKWYGITWGNGTMQVRHGTRQLQFGVNLLVFVLTQEGSITHRVMDAVR